MHAKKCKSYFITGTDTEIGKTTTTKLIASKLIKKNYQVVCCKPVACGGIHEQNFYNEDALAYQELNSIPLPYSAINPYLFRDPISPNIASKQTNCSLTSQGIIKKIQDLLHLPIDYLLIEGLGGWLVPINQHETMADFVHALDLPIIIVVGLRIGCLNHTFLTLESIRKSKLKIAGWIANLIDPKMLAVEENIRTLQRWINEPFLGYVPFCNDKLNDYILDLTTL